MNGLLGGLGDHLSAASLAQQQYDYQRTAMLAAQMNNYANSSALMAACSERDSGDNPVLLLLEPRA